LKLHEELHLVTIFLVTIAIASIKILYLKDNVHSMNLPIKTINDIDEYFGFKNINFYFIFYFIINLIIIYNSNLDQMNFDLSK